MKFKEGDMVKMVNDQDCLFYTDKFYHFATL